MTTDVAELLRSMPDLEPPADAWHRIAAKHARRMWLDRAHWGGGLVAAASVVIAIIGVALYLERPEVAAVPVAQSVIKPIIVSAPAIRPDVRAADAQVRALQRRSHYMERVLSQMPRRGRVAHADTAGVIAELEDRIAAVDYQLNRTGVNRMGADPASVGWSGRQVPVSGPRYESTDTSDLWRHRVEFMDQLVRARYTEAGVNGF